MKNFDSLDDLINSDSEEIVYIDINKLKPDPDQDRSDWDSSEAQNFIVKLANSMSLKLPDGSLYGIRDPLDICPKDSDGKYQIISGETRWRAGQLAGIEKAPCIVRTYKDGITKRFDHVTENSIKRNLNLYERARSIKKDIEENGFSPDTIITLHGLTGKTQMNKLLKVLELEGVALSLVKESYIKDVNLVYDLAKLSEEEVEIIKNKVDHEGQSISSAIKEAKQKESKIDDEEKNSSNEKKPKESKKSVKEENDVAKLTLTYNQALLIAKKLKVESIATTTKELVKDISKKLSL